MKTTTLALAATLLAGTAMAQSTAPGATPGNTAPGATSNAPMTGVSPSTGVTPGTGVVGRNSGTAAASGDRNQAVATTSANAPQPARGRSSFSEAQARRRIESRGFQQVTGLRKDEGGVWRGTAMRDGASVPVWLDYKGNISPAGGATSASSSTTGVPGTTLGTTPGSTLGTTPGTALGGRNVDGTVGNPPGTAAGRAIDRSLGTNSTGTNPGATRP